MKLKRFYAQHILFYLFILIQFITSSNTCSEYSDCESCINSLDCHWCKSSKSCVSLEEKCKSVCRLTDPKQCNTKCAEFNNCSDCIANDCSWCDGTKSCHDRCIDELEMENCVCLRNNLEECTIEKQCNNLKTCNECLKNSSCGWCKESKQCISINNNKKPCYPIQPCKYFSYDTCENECNGNTDCTTCLNDITGCYWCAGAKSPFGYNISLCTMQSNDCIVKFNSTCPNCKYTNTSMECLKIEHCGWCNRTHFQTCEEGNSISPYDSRDCKPSNWIGRKIPAPIEPGQPNYRLPNQDIGIGIGIGLFIALCFGIITFKCFNKLNFTDTAIGS